MSETNEKRRRERRPILFKLDVRFGSCSQSPEIILLIADRLGRFTLINIKVHLASHAFELS